MASKKGKKNLKKYDGIIGRRADGEAVTRPFRGRTVAEAKQQYHTYLTEHGIDAERKSAMMNFWCAVGRAAGCWIIRSPLSARKHITLRMKTPYISTSCRSSGISRFSPSRQSALVHFTTAYLVCFLRVCAAKSACVLTRFLRLRYTTTCAIKIRRNLRN